MYIFDLNKKYHIKNNIIYENDIPIILDKTKIMSDWDLSKKEALLYVQGRLFALIKRFEYIKKSEQVKEQVKEQITILL